MFSGAKGESSQLPVMADMPAQPDGTLIGIEEVGFLGSGTGFHFLDPLHGQSQVRQAILEQCGQRRAFGLTGLVLEVIATPDQGWQRSNFGSKQDAGSEPIGEMIAPWARISKGL
jgi:hypothetical protein